MYNQMTIYIPTVAEVGTKSVQGINRETYIENQENNYWYLLEKLYANGESRECRIRDIKYDHRMPINRNVIEYRSFQQFFDENELTRRLSPIMHAPTYLTLSGAANHSLFYAWKTPQGEYKKFSPVKHSINMFNPNDNIDYSPIISVVMLRNGQLIENNDKYLEEIAMKFQQTSSIYDTDIALWNLNLAKNAILSNSPDGAVNLYNDIARFSIQLFGKLVPELFQAIFDLMVQNSAGVDYFRSHKIDILEMEIDEKIHDMRQQHSVCGGWWHLETNSDNRLMPHFTLCNATKKGTLKRA